MVDPCPPRRAGGRSYILSTCALSIGFVYSSSGDLGLAGDGGIIEKRKSCKYKGMN